MPESIRPILGGGNRKFANECYHRGMTFPRKGTRRLVVAGIQFFWHMSPKYVDSGGSACVVQAANGRGRLLCFWPVANDGFPSPKETCDLIAFALDGGWDPTEEGKPPLWVARTTRGLHLQDTAVLPPWAAT
jgi:hypothetical protein